MYTSAAVTSHLYTVPAQIPMQMPINGEARLTNRWCHLVAALCITSLNTHTNTPGTDLARRNPKNILLPFRHYAHQCALCAITTHLFVISEHIIYINKVCDDVLYPYTHIVSNV